MKLQIVIDGKTYEVEYDAPDENASHPTASVSSAEHAQSIVLRMPQVPVPGTNDIDESKLRRSPTAGIVARVDVEVGQSVREGDLILVVEAMKMENNLTAGGAGRVKSVKVKVGDSVKANQIVVEFE